MMNTDRYLHSSYFETRETRDKWHRINESKMTVYTATTRCGLTTNYPSLFVQFRHPNDPRGTYPDCQECTA